MNSCKDNPTKISYVHLRHYYTLISEEIDSLKRNPNSDPTIIENLEESKDSLGQTLSYMYLNQKASVSVDD